MKELPQNYDHKEAESRWQRAWEEKGVYRWNQTEPREANYVIDTPPPTVSGVLHMGHIFSYTQADFIARYQRMKGKNVFYPMGFDDNGLPTERLVEKVKKVRAHQLSREEFIALCQDVTVDAENQFRALFKSTALSVDWSQEYQTISEDSRRISQLSFLDLYRKGEAYRELKPMLWDPVDQTAIAQAEVEDKEMESFANYIPFGIVEEDADPSQVKWGGIEKVTIMTTRPELLAACVALMCHPDDAAKYKGKSAITPLYGVKVPIIADEKVDKEKGTGLVMCCTFGDETDIHWQQKHSLPIRVVLNKYGKIDLSGEWPNANKDRAYCDRLEHELKTLNGLKASNRDPKQPGAREKIIEILKANGLLLKQESITHAVKCAERSGAPLEILPTQQWFIRVMDKKAALKEKAARCTWHPAYMKVRMDQWIDGLSWDWCISRQRFSGVPFPVWFVEEESGVQNPESSERKVIVARPEDLPVNPLVDLPRGYKETAHNANGSVQAIEEATGKNVVIFPDTDIMDTWATSSVSPQLNSRGINRELDSGLSTLDSERHSRLFPADLRPQAHEIIRTWAFYTIVKAHLHEDTIPWKNLMISGWCLAADKTKMSKSKGNVITPVELIEDKSADAVRFWASTSRLGADTAFSEDVLKIGKKLVNKLWNASKFAGQHLDNLPAAPKSAAEDVREGRITEALDLWILSRLQHTIATADAEFARYEYSAARAAAEEFFWKEFCDNYLEMIKARAYGQHAALSTQHSALYTLHHCLDAILHLFAPFVPHITEELFSLIFPEKHAQTGSVHARGFWPESSAYPRNETAEQSGIAACALLDCVRKLKAEKNVSIKWPLEKISVSCSAQDWALLAPALADLQQVSSAAAIVQASTTEGVKSDDGRFTVSAIFAASAGAA